MQLHCKENITLEGRLGFVLITTFSYWVLIVYNAQTCQNATEMKLPTT